MTARTTLRWLAAVLALHLAAPLAARSAGYLEAAEGAARWLDLSAAEGHPGTVWPADPQRPDSVTLDLYHGVPGVVLFFLELSRATGQPAHLDRARGGADHLLAALPDRGAAADDGLYSGVAGIGFALLETFAATSDPRYREGAVQVVELLRRRARPVGAGVEWNDVTDIVSGSAGIGLFLLRAAEDLADPRATQLALEAGARLLERARKEATGLSWAMDSTFPRRMPNFSHGTAGVAYFLASLHQATGRPEFLAAALAGARHLVAIADTRGGVCLIHHHRPGGEDLHYLSWCHGPAGTARLFYRLGQVTGDPTWMDWVRRSARGILASGVPERRTPGFWNNVGPCCGSAGVAEFFLGLHRATGEAGYLESARRVTADLLARAVPDRGGLSWPQAEHRIRPREVVAQTGYMQGAAGIGVLLLRLDAVERGREVRLVFPDSPF